MKFILGAVLATVALSAISTSASAQPWHHHHHCWWHHHHRMCR